jgi:Family of unknown function (DUF5752)
MHGAAAEPAPAPRPFEFTGCIELREILGRRARDERELMEEIEGAPAESIYYHTDSVFLRRPLVAGSYPNDFAIWVASQIRDQVLAERLGMVDPFQFDSLERVREEILSILDDHLEGLNPVPRVVFGDPFFFVRSHLIEVPTGMVARTLREFRAALAEVDVSAIYLHALDARSRRGVRGGQFAEWLGESLGLTELADRVARLNPYLGGLERIRVMTLALVDAELEGALGGGAGRR